MIQLIWVKIMKIPKEDLWNIDANCMYVVVFCTKYRRDLLVDKVEQRLRELLEVMAAEMQVEILEMNIISDSVRLLVRVDPRFGIHRAIKHMKAYSSRNLRQEFQLLRTRVPTLWSNSYYVTSVGVVSESHVQQYIKTQGKY